MSWFPWWRRLKQSLRPRSAESAQESYRKLSVLYIFFGWNAIGLVGFNVLQKLKSKSTLSDEDLELSPGQQLAKEMGKENAKVIRISGFTVIPVKPIPSKEQRESEILKE